MKACKLYRVGNALVLAIPTKYAKALNLDGSTTVAVTLANRMLYVERARITGEGNHAAPPPGSEADRG